MRLELTVEAVGAEIARLTAQRDYWRETALDQDAQQSVEYGLTKRQAEQYRQELLDGEPK